MLAFIEPKRRKGKRDFNIYGHFLEHFHRQVYGGVYDPGSPLSNEEGIRMDVVEALKEIKTPVLRWPGGCFVSAYHWKDGIGKERVPTFDKAWRVEDPNTFGTDEFLSLCRAIGTEPYICTNAGTGTPEEMSDWVEYCNLKNEGRWAKERIENGYSDPFNVKYWSIGNENYGVWEIGAKSADEFAKYVLESAKMMKRVDTSIEILAASTPDLDWNIKLLKEAGPFLDWISIHGYWDRAQLRKNLSNYETCMAFSTTIEEPIVKTKNILGALGYLGKIRIAFDEWNLRGWHHPHIHQFKDVPAEESAKLWDVNDINSGYTMADAVFSACFLNQCLKHNDVVGMANFSPIVNTRGAIFTHEKGIVLRPTYFVFKLYTNYLGDEVVDSWLPENHLFEVQEEEDTFNVPSLDIIPTTSNDGKELRVAIVNRHPDKTIPLELNTGSFKDYQSATLYSVVGETKDSYNDIDRPNEVGIVESSLKAVPGESIALEISPHSVNVLVLQ